MNNGMEIIAEDSRKALDKLEHKIHNGIAQVNNGVENIITALYEIKEKKLFLLKGAKTIREYILSLNLPQRLNLHISSIFLKLQIRDYAKSYSLNYQAVKEIGETKFKVLVQTEAKLHEDVTLEGLKKMRLVELEHHLRGGKKSSEAQATPEKEPEEKEDLATLPIRIDHVKRVSVDDKREVLTIQLNKGNFSKYFGILREFPKVTFER